ncbi:MAG: TonB-dependent receptor [Ferruginibacter sp.]
MHAFYGLHSQAQAPAITDSVMLLDNVVITAFQQNNTVNSGTIVKVLTTNNADRYNKTSLVHAFNTVAGVRMEERSPGSYRINIRGSSLRSPFGVRNVKVYWNDIPVTDAGGNTYFNQFSFNNFSGIEIFKGPAGSMYGAGTGGLVLMHSFGTNYKPALNAEYITGSFGLQQLLFTASTGNENNRMEFTTAHTKTDGYRDNTQNRKDNFSFNTQFNISPRQQVSTSVLYTDMYYQTPGGLTLTEFTNNPKQARPAAGGLPSAANAKAAIYQKNFLAGITHACSFSAKFKNSTTVYGAFAQIKNPTFRNYERRSEPGLGGRTVFTYELYREETMLQLSGGAEVQEGFFNTLVSKNKNGNPDTVLTNDDIHYQTRNVFVQAVAGFKHGWNITAGASINRSLVKFTRLNTYPVSNQERKYSNEISPRISVQKKIAQKHTVFASVSSGFSPPTIAELLPSTGVISTFLEAEKGMNYEAGARLMLFKNRLRAEATVYYFKLRNALVSRKDSSNADYFVNAGSTRQNGTELSADYAVQFSNLFIKTLIVRGAYAFSDFRYADFRKGNTDYSGKKLPGVPASTFTAMADMQFAMDFYLNASWYYTDKMFMDDANTAAAKQYHLLGTRVGWKTSLQKKWRLNIYAGADNLLNEVYSLGNDINAAGGRYYNTAPSRNYYAGIQLQYDQHVKK